MPFAHVHPALMVAASLAGAIGVITWRIRETATPVTVRKIIIPPLGMSTGLFMFVVPDTHVPWSWAALALFIGATLFAYPLSRTSKLARQGDQIVMERSKAFLAILLVLVAIRFGLRAWIELYVTMMQTGALFFLLAFGAIVRWRVAMLRQYLRLRAAPQQ